MLFDCIVIAIIYFLYYRKWKKQGTAKLVHKTLFFIYCVCVVWLTLMPIISSIPSIFSHSYSYNSVIFSDVIFKRGDYKRQIILNIIMTIPFGFCMKWIYKKSFLKAFIITVLVVCFIELIQPIIHVERIGDITDMFTNTLGGVIGYLIATLFIPLTKKASIETSNKL